MSRILIVRHAKAEDGYPDERRQLAPRGKKDARAMGRRLVRAAITVDVVVHSGLDRARETAEILAEALGCKAVEQREGLTPWDSAAALEPWLRTTAVAGRSVMLVSHQPLCGDLLTTLTGGPAPVMPTCAVAAIQFDGAGWVLRWLATPESP